MSNGLDIRKSGSALGPAVHWTHTFYFFQVKVLSKCLFPLFKSKGAVVGLL